jgi:outer membrane protein assembly factor BamD
LDEKKDLQPLVQAKEKFEFIIFTYPETDYATDSRFKLDLIIDQLAAKEMSIARYYMKTEKWIPALNRLKIVVEKYDKTVFIEEALHRLVEVYYNIGLVEEAKQAAAILGYNYQSGTWYERSYKVFNKEYKTKKIKKTKEMGLIRRKIKGLFE